jgi:hypothetical protein
LVRSYTAEFKRLAAKLNLGETAFILYFYRGLRNDIKDKLNKKDYLNILYKYIIKVIKVDNRLYERKLKYKRGITV